MSLSVIIWAYMLLFTALKLCGQIDWSWWVIYSPLLVSIVLNAIAVVYERCNEDYRKAKEQQRIIDAIFKHKR